MYPAAHVTLRKITRDVRGRRRELWWKPSHIERGRRARDGVQNTERSE